MKEFLISFLSGVSVAVTVGLVNIISKNWPSIKTWAIDGSGFLLGQIYKCRSAQFIVSSNFKFKITYTIDALAREYAIFTVASLMASSVYLSILFLGYQQFVLSLWTIFLGTGMSILLSKIIL